MDLLRNLPDTLFAAPYASLVLAVVAVVAAPALARYAAARSVTRPVLCPVAAEQVVLASLLRHPGPIEDALTSSALTPPAFSLTTHQRVFDQLHRMPDPAQSPTPTTPTTPGQQRAALLREWAAALLDGPDPLDQRVLDGILDPTHSRPIAPDAGTDPLAGHGRDVQEQSYDDAVEEVRAAHEDRTTYAGAAPIVPTSTPDSLDPAVPPMRRTHRPPPRSRHIVTGIAAAAMAALIPGFAAAVLDGSPNPAAVGFAAAALIVMTVTTLVVSLVDLDTFYLDTQVWAAGSAASWLLAAVAVTVAGTPGHLLVALAAVVAVWVLFETTNALFRRLRGHDGQGFGDTLIIILTVGVPVALTGDPVVAVWSVLGAQVAGIVGWSATALRRGLSREDPIALGPYLAFGWVLGLLMHVSGAGAALMYGW